MIKFFCDKCGKEITDNVNITTDETEVKDCHGSTLVKFTRATYQYCDECMKDDLTCGFKMGDMVITSTGETGLITDICTCDNCKKRGFYEPVVATRIGTNKIYITDNDKRVNFRSFYKIGNKVFGNIDEDVVDYKLTANEESMEKLIDNQIELRKQKDIISEIRKGTFG